MAAPHIAVLTQVEWNSASHRVGDYVYDVPQGDVFDNTFQLPMTKRDKPRVGGLHARMGFSFQAAGSGSAGTAPADGPLMRACGFKEAISAGVSVTYSITGDLITDPTATNVYGHPGKALKDTCGNAIGNWTLELVAGEPAKVGYELIGIYAAQSETLASAALGTTALPVVCKGLTLTIGGYTLVVKSATIMLNNTLTLRPDIAGTNGYQDPKITDMVPSFTALVETPDYSTVNFWTDFVAETKHTLHAVLGSVAGNIITLDCDGYMDTNPVASDTDGIIHTGVSYKMSWTDAETQLQLVYT